MHLVVATPHYPPESGGPATYAKILAEQFPSLGVMVNTVPFETVRRFKKIFRPVLYGWLILRAAWRANAILALDPVSTGVPAAIAAGLLNKPFFVKIVGDCAWERGRERYGIAASLDDFVHTRRIPAPLRAYRAAQRWVAGRASRIIVPSNYLKSIVVAWGVPPDKIEVVYNSIELGPTGSLPGAVSALHGFTIVTVGRLVQWKHVDKIILARDELAAANLIIVGDGPERCKLEELARCRPRILFTGELRNEDTLAIMKSADVLVLNSSYEGMSHVLIEGLLTAVPIVATRAGGNEEVLQDGSGVLVPVGDTAALARELRRLQDDRTARDALRNAATKRAEAFSTETMLERTKGVLMAAAAND